MRIVYITTLVLALAVAGLACSPASDAEPGPAPAAGPSPRAPTTPKAEPVGDTPPTQPAGPNLSPSDERDARGPQYNRGKQLRGLYSMNIREGRLDPVLTGLSKPWAFEFIDDHHLLITEIGGRLYRFEREPKRLVEITGLPDIATSEPQTGLLDIEIHPDFARNQRIYFSYVESDPGSGRYYQTVIATATIENDTLVGVEQIVVAAPYSWAPSIFGGALEFDDEGFLYVSIGDRGEHERSQQGDNLQGKILRLNDDGTAPADNPFVDDPDIDDRIYALGARNAQGLHFDAPSGLLFETEHGPLGGDEVNIIEAGGNYGWPEITYGMAYSYGPMGQGTHKTGMAQPLWFYLPSIATSPITVYRGGMFPELDGDLLVGALRGKTISRLVRDDRVIRSEYRFLSSLNARIRDIKVARDGAIWVLIEYGGLFRLSREPVVTGDAGSGLEGGQIYDAVCAGCHDAGAYGAPTLDKAAQWPGIRSKDREVVDRNVRDGLGSMPARGLCNFCSDDDLRQVVDYMLENAPGD